jgi:cytochrome c
MGSKAASYTLLGLCGLAWLWGVPWANAADSPVSTRHTAAKIQETNDMLAAADSKNGHQIFQECAPCHSFDKGGPNQTGPNLFGIVGAHHAHEQAFLYSNALRKMQDRIWTTDALDQWLKAPERYAPGTTMNYGGLLDPQDRADLIAYLMTLR